jgi:hypothetical protein
LRCEFYWTFDYFFYNAAKCPLRGRFAAYLALALIFPETLTASAFQGKSAQFSQKSRTFSTYPKTQILEGVTRQRHALQNLGFRIGS